MDALKDLWKGRLDKKYSLYMLWNAFPKILLWLFSAMQKRVWFIIILIGKRKYVIKLPCEDKERNLEECEDCGYFALLYPPTWYSTVLRTSVGLDK